MANESTDFAKQLEAYMDRCGVTVTVQLIADIAHAKAKQARELGPNEPFAQAAAKRWAQLAAYLRKVAWQTIIRTCPRP